MGPAAELLALVLLAGASAHLYAQKCLQYAFKGRKPPCATAK